MTASVGDAITFTNSDPSFVHGVQAASANWSFDTGPILPGGMASTPALAAAGVYDFGGSGLDHFHGQVLVGSARASGVPAVVPARSAPVSPPARPPSGALAVQRSGRRYGLPVSLAVVAVMGVGSLLWRVLLAHPAARADGSVRPRR